MQYKWSVKNKSAIAALRKTLQGQDKAFAELLLSIGREGQKEIRKQIGIWVAASNSGLGSKGAQGDLAMSFKLSDLSVSGSVGRITISSDSVYAAIHNTGGVIEGTPLLSIPGKDAIKFFKNPQITQKDLSSQGNFLIKRAVIKPKNYLFNAQREIEQNIPKVARAIVRTDWAKYFTRTT